MPHVDVIVSDQGGKDIAMGNVGVGSDCLLVLVHYHDYAASSQWRLVMLGQCIPLYVMHWPSITYDCHDCTSDPAAGTSGIIASALTPSAQYTD